MSFYEKFNSYLEGITQMYLSIPYFLNINVGFYPEYDKLFDFYEVPNFDKNISIDEVISKFIMERVFYYNNLKNPIPNFPRDIIKKVGHDNFKADLENWLCVTNNNSIIHNTFMSNEILEFIHNNFDNNISFYSVDLFNSYIDKFDLDSIDFAWGCGIKTYFFCNDKNCYFLSLYVALD